jgi:acyl-CoA-binding protein
MDLSFPEKYHAVSRYFDFYIGNLEETPLLTDEQRLLFYALRQQAEHGPCTAPQPSMWYMTERHKHQAWKQLGRMSTFEAMVFFVQQFERTLWALEHPDDDEAALVKAKVDWVARLQELAPQASAVAAEAAPPHNSSPENLKKEAKGDVCHNKAEKPSLMTEEVSSASAPSAEVVKPKDAPSSSPPPLSTRVPAEEMQGWDSDIVTHATVSLDNIRYLATQLMQARKALRQKAREPVSEAERYLRCSQAEALPVPTPPVLMTGQASHTLAAAPPLKPMWTLQGKTMRVPIIPPPVRFSARSLTEAAVRPPRKAFSVRGTSQNHIAAHTDASNSWFAW